MRAERELAHLAIKHEDTGAITADAPQLEANPSKPARRKQPTATGKGARITKAKAKGKERVLS